MDRGELDSILRLLDDPNMEIYKIVESKILSFGRQAIPDLERARESSLNALLQRRAEHILEQIQFDILTHDLSDWLDAGALDLLYGAYLIARYQYSGIEFEKIRAQIDYMADLISAELNPSLTPIGKVKAINHILFDVEKFTRNVANYLAPQNSFINDVLEIKKGNTISLSVVYIEVAQKLGLPVYGVNLPINYIVVFLKDFCDVPYTDNFASQNVMFYLNPIHRGNVLGTKEIDYFLTQQNIKPNSSFFEPCSNRDTIGRLVQNLMTAYTKMGNENKAQSMRKLEHIIYPRFDL